MWGRASRSESFGSHDTDGFLGGIQGGCDYQFAGGFVIGIQADYAWTNADSSSVSVLRPDVDIRSNIDSLGRLLFGSVMGGTVSSAT